MTPENHHQQKILIVDDTPSTISTVRTVLKEHGYTVFVATSGEAALEIAELNRPDLILLDILMPGMDGYDTCKHLKAGETTKDIPIIFMTVVTESFNKVKGFQLGAVDYLTKPVEPEELLARVKTHLSIARLQQELQTVNASLEQQVAVRTAELRAANTQLQLELAERRRAEEALRRLNRKFSALSNCNQALMRAEDEQTLLNDICHIICDEAGYRMAWVGYAEHDEAKTVRPVAWGGVEEGYLAAANITWADTERGHGVTGTVIRTGVNICIQNFMTDPQAVPWRENALQRGYRSSLAVPLKDKHAATFGALTIYSTEPDAFTPDEIRLMEELANDLAFGITTLRTRAEHKRMEQALILREQEYRTLVEHIPDLIVRYDTNLHRIYVNPAWENASGLAAGEVIHMDGDPLPKVPKPTVVEYVEKIQTVLETGASQTLEFRWVNPSGGTLFLEYTIVPEYDQDGNIKGVLSAGHDVTERKRMEEILRQSEHRKTLLNQIANIFLTIPDEEMYAEVLSVILQALPSPFGILGYIGETGDLIIPSLTGAIWNECQVPDKSFVFPSDTWGESLWGKAIREGKAFISDGPFHTPEGHVPIDHFLTVPIVFGQETIGILSAANKAGGYTEADKELLEYIAAYVAPILKARLQRDIQERERKRAEEALRESERLLAEIAANYPNSYLSIVEHDFTIGFTSGQEFKKQHLDPRSVEGLSLEQVFGEQTPTVREQYLKAFQGEETSFELFMNNQYQQYNVVPLYDQHGHIPRILAVVENITARKLAEEEIRRLNRELEQRVLDRTAQLEAANKELEAFAYSVSHDLRAPLRHIDGFLELLQQRIAGTLDAQSQHYMDTIADAARRMGMLIDDLLAFSRMGRHELASTPVDLNVLARDVIREMEPETRNRDIHWQIADLPVVAGDRAMLRIVFGNLIANAVKFTRPRDRAEIDIGCQAGQDIETVVYVRDNGVGFDMQYADKLFGVFQRLHRMEDFEGTGIGLANVRRIITRHGGRTWAEGAVDQGATFYVALPSQRV